MRQWNMAWHSGCSERLQNVRNKAYKRNCRIGAEMPCRTGQDMKWAAKFGPVRSIATLSSGTSHHIRWKIIKTNWNATNRNQLFCIVIILKHNNLTLSHLRLFSFPERIGVSARIFIVTVNGDLSYSSLGELHVTACSRMWMGMQNWHDRKREAFHNFDLLNDRFFDVFVIHSSVRSFYFCRTKW